MRNVVHIALEKEGYFILAAGHGEEALGVAERYPGEIHLLLSDVNVPIMGGVELTQRMLRRRPSTKVVLMSAVRPSGRDAAFLQKPFGPAALQDMVRTVLGDPVLNPPTAGTSNAPAG